MRATWEQVDIVALGPNLYLWLKNTAKIHILICTPNAGEWDCRSRMRNPHILVYYIGYSLKNKQIWRCIRQQ